MVIENMDVLVQMKNNSDKPEEMANLKKRLTGEKQRWEDELTEVNNMSHSWPDKKLEDENQQEVKEQQTSSSKQRR